MVEPVCSVCIANYNGMAILAACLDSIVRQEGENPLEIIVHDDASRDESVEFIRQHYPTVVLIESRENVGFCVANNRMAALAKGEFLLLLNNDAALWPDALATLLAAARALGRPAILSLPQYEWETGELLDRGSRLDPFLNPVPNRNPDRHDVGLVMGACLWIPRRLWAELGGFPEWFGSIGEDLYLCCRARLAGYPVRVLDRSGYRHQVGRSFGGGKVAAGRLATTFRRRVLSERNKTFVMMLTFPTPMFQVVFPLHLLLLLLEGTLLSLVKWDRRLFGEIYGPVFGALGREWRRLWQMRREVQQSRRLSAWGFWSVFQWIPYKLTALMRHGLPDVR
jgi:GT2 family glycosyltransferase